MTDPQQPRVDLDTWEPGEDVDSDALVKHELERLRLEANRPLVSLDALADVIDGYSYGWDWAALGGIKVNPCIWFEPPTTPRENYLDALDRGETVLITIGYWDDGEKWLAPGADHPAGDTLRAPKGAEYKRVHLSYQTLSNALYALSEGRVTDDPYQRTAATDLIHTPYDADGDANTTDLLVQWAVFGEVVYG